MKVGRVAELFEISGRGAVVVIDTSYEQLPQDLCLKIGDSVDFRNGTEVTLKSTVTGIEHCDPWTPRQKFAFLLPRDVPKDAVPVGSEVWTTA